MVNKVMHGKETRWDFSLSNKQDRVITGGRGGIRTRGLWLRRPTLYPAELPAHFAGGNVETCVSGFLEHYR